MQPTLHAGSSGQSLSQHGSAVAATSVAIVAETSVTVAPNRDTASRTAKKKRAIVAISIAWHRPGNAATHDRLIALPKRLPTGGHDSSPYGARQLRLANRLLPRGLTTPGALPASAPFSERYRSDQPPDRSICVRLMVDGEPTKNRSAERRSKSSSTRQWRQCAAVAAVDAAFASPGNGYRGQQCWNHVRAITRHLH